MALRVSRTTGKLFELYRVLTDKEVKMKTRCKLLESCIRYRLISATPTILPKSHEMVKLESCNFFRRMIRGGSSKRTQNQGFAFKYSCSDRIVGTPPLRYFIETQYLKYTAHNCRYPNDTLTKRALFARPQRK